MARDRPVVATAETQKGYKNFGFDFEDGQFLAITQSHDRHPRATIAELRDHFAHGTSLDRDAGWYEAQLIHYGIAHSVWKPKARMDLHDSLNLGLLAVPVELRDLEREMRDVARQKAAAAYAVKFNVPTIGGIKGKADERVLTFPFIGPSGLRSERSERSERAEPEPDAGSGLGSEHGATLADVATDVEPALDSESAPDTDPENNDNSWVDDDRRSMTPGHDRPSSIGLNGRYQVECPYVTEHWPDYRSHLYLVFAIEGRSVWATFNFGQVDGVMYFPVKPTRVSDPPMPCMWRGRGVSGRNVSREDNTGWIKFLQFGELEGELYDQDTVVKFTAKRRNSPANLTPIPLEAMQDKWEGYSEAANARDRKVRRR